MPSKILLADKSITIQKVVEMLFSGKEYSVTAVSDGDAALSEAARILPDVVLADVDLPRVDGYTFSSRLKQTPQTARTPVILMLSRDDVYDAAKGASAGIVDHIAKPFESQDLIGKIRKALTGAPAAVPAPAAAARPAAAPPRPAPEPPPPKPKQAVPSDIFDIIQEAPSSVDVRRAPAAPPAAEPPAEESLYEVEPELEMEEPAAADLDQALPKGAKAIEEMRAGLGIGEEPLPRRTRTPGLEFLGELPGETPAAAPPKPVRAAPAAAPPAPAPAVSEDMVRALAEETIERIAREVLERIAWEVIPQLAETMIREEIEKLKAETLPQ